MGLYSAMPPFGGDGWMTRTDKRVSKQVAIKQTKRKREVAAAVTEPVAHAVVAAPAAASPAKMPVYKLAPSCTVRDCATLKTALSDLVDVQGEAVLDVAAVERIDTAVVQLLYAFVRDRKAQGGKVVWAGNSECFAEAVNLLGLATHLDMPHAAGGAR